ncbi:RICIN domain-containing protein [Streptomyces sp. NPDC001606]
MTPALHPVGELLDRHWEAAFAYARLCTEGPRAAGMLTTAAFTRLFGEALRQVGPAAAWRPRVLVAVRRIAAEWDADGRQDLLHPGLRSGAGAGERPAVRLLPPPGRRLLARAFQRVPQTARTVLWHIEAEGDPPAVPAVLLGLDEADIDVELRRARERLRDECLQAHRELAPQAECLRYQRLLDVTFRRGGADLDPDLREHLAGCDHCTRTADQLAVFQQGLGLALAEAVLGWGARAYHESRAHRAQQPTAPSPAPAAVPPPPGEAFLPFARTDHPADPLDLGEPAGSAAVAAPGAVAASGRSALRAARRARRRTLALAAVTVSGLVVLPLVLWSALGSGDGTAPGPAGTATPPPGGGSRPPGASWAGTNGAGRGTFHGRLRSLASGLCIAVSGPKAVDGAETELATCSAAPSQQWTYEADGLLRNAADPDLCLDSHLSWSVRLAPCTATGRAARNIRYDFTAQGALLPRWNEELALTPAATDGSGALVVKTRAPGAAQRWSVDTAKPRLEMRNVDWASDTTPAPAPSTAPQTGTPSATPVPSPTPSTAPPSPSPSRSVVIGHWGGRRHRR